MGDSGKNRKSIKTFRLQQPPNPILLLRVHSAFCFVFVCVILVPFSFWANNFALRISFLKCFVASRVIL